MLKGKCIIFSAPSGAGKTTIVKRLIGMDLSLTFSISACTRSPRGNEEDGKDYHFLSIDSFKEKIKNDEFVEWEEVYHDHFYGTLKSEVEHVWSLNRIVIFDVDVVGGLNLKQYFGEQALAIFVMPPSIDTLEKRLKSRATDSPERIENRLAKAKEELSKAGKFDHVLLNDDLELAIQKAHMLVKNFLDS